tara:strand:- start:1616 stop:1756 length:141 start_codon:yes stop_codon:yes gene_type:complete
MIRTCRECNRILPDDEQALQSVTTALWFCVKCFEKKVGRKINDGLG